MGCIEFRSRSCGDRYAWDPHVPPPRLGPCNAQSHVYGARSTPDRSIAIPVTIPHFTRSLFLRRKFLLVEDGDRKGFQSNKGLAAKKAAGIKTLKLSPRSPCFMPLDYKIWEIVDKKMVSCAPKGRESKADFIRRLKGCAKRVCTQSFLTKTVGQMKGRLNDVFHAKGLNPKKD
jgi:hypothetical protein